MLWWIWWYLKREREDEGGEGRWLCCFVAVVVLRRVFAFCCWLVVWVVLCCVCLFCFLRFGFDREKSLTNLFLGRREKERFCFRCFFFGLKFRERESKLRRQEFVLLYKENKKISWTKEKETVFLFILCFYCRYSERINECFLSNRETGAKSWYGA